MAWNWTFADWPEFRFDATALNALERRFLMASGEIVGAVKHVSEGEHVTLRIELLSDEAVKTSQIEGEILDRDSVQSSLRLQMGLTAGPGKARPQERGIAEMITDLYGSWASPLDHDTLHRWHAMLMAGNNHIETIGAYRIHPDAMQIVSGPIHRQVVHFEAPPSAEVPAQMDGFIAWFNASAPGGSTPLPALTRAGIGHLYFESIHPFEDGNGRLGRALAEKSMAQNIGQPSLIALAYSIERGRKAYYDQLAAHQTTLDITEWLLYFAQTVLDAQQTTLARVAFYIAKARFHERFRDRLNERQQKAITRMFREGPDGFKGGLSAENYIAITGTSRATATRDLHDLVEKQALTRTGQLRHTRYALKLPAS
jgi:Fic family protein